MKKKLDSYGKKWDFLGYDLMIEKFANLQYFYTYKKQEYELIFWVEQEQKEVISFVKNKKNLLLKSNKQILNYYCFLVAKYYEISCIVEFGRFDPPL